MLAATANALLTPGKGLLAMDESVATCNRRLTQAKVDMAQPEQARRNYRELLVTTPGLSAYISGAILFEESFYQCSQGGPRFVRIFQEAGILVGIKLDTGTTVLAGHPGESVTEGLDGLRERLPHFAALGARFAKWRAVFSIADGHPSQGCIAANANALARYAMLCQEAQIVPIVEPEVLMDGSHTLARCAAATTKVLHAVFEQLYVQGVALNGMILKPNMVLPGLGAAASSGGDEMADDIADATLDCLLRNVPAAVAGVAFLSGGQPSVVATLRLQALYARSRSRGLKLPWPLSFSFGRALQQPALDIWRGHAENRHAAQQALLHRARCNAAAATGGWLQCLEEEGQTRGKAQGKVQGKTQRHRQACTPVHTPEQREGNTA